MKDEQLSWSFDGDEISGEFVYAGNTVREADPEMISAFMWPVTSKPIDVSDFSCKHKVIFRACKKGYVTYCNKCGKILSVRNRREK